ncbi:hypothetical protein FNV43_RR13205 [Rhamnella rubrinervis]|uniref:SHSP domain-containing protein n=1 Tax=Rhamnella rubrinervis TaxID=2594499 RepID=A0A8K0H0M1_9ROSA|nr:hypothetical protein FNV43_RR13205 [Rhamnella rubrinervis]
MSIIPIHNNDDGRQVNVFDPFSDLWDPFLDFPFPSTFSRTFPEFNMGTSGNFRLDWRETPTAHISTDSGNSMSRFKLPDNAMIEQLKASMNTGVLTVTIPEEASRPSESLRNLWR